MFVSLNASINPKTILPDSSIEVNKRLTVTSCPVCTSTGFYIMPDPEGGYWYSCSKCNFSGDSIQLYAWLGQLQIKQALTKLKHEGTLTDAQMQVQDDYMRLLGARKKIDEYFDTCADTSRLEPTKQNQLGKEIISAFDLHSLAKTNAKAFAGLVGVTTKGEYETLVGGAVVGPGLLGNKFKSYIVSPMVDVPGRPVAMAAFDYYNNTKRYTAVKLPYGSLDALMMVGQSVMRSDVVYATSDLSFCLDMHVAARVKSIANLPLVGYTGSTSAAWNMLRPRKVVFWDPIFTPDIFIAARKVSERAFIAVKPSFEKYEDPILRISGSPDQFLVGLEPHAISWLALLKDFLLGNSQAEVRDVVDVLDLTPLHQQEMLAYCDTPEEKEKLATLLDTGIIQLSIPTGVKGSLLVQKPTGLWLQWRGDSDSHLACEAVPIVDAFTTFKSKAVYSGKIKFRNRAIPFTVDRDDFCAEWLIRYCQENGAVVTVDKTLAKNFAHLLLQLNRPTQTQGLECIGKQSDGTFAFPRFSIKTDGTLVEEVLPLSSPHPMAKIESNPVIDRARLQLSLEPGNCQVLYWATMAAIVDNIINGPTGIGVVEKGLVSSIVKQVTEDTGLKRVSYNISTADLLAAEAAHAVPLFIDFCNTLSVPAFAKEAGPRNTLCLIPPGTIDLLQLRGEWTIINVDSPASINVTTVPGLLQFVIQHHMRTRLNDPFKLFASWLRQEHGIEAPVVLDRSKASTSVSDTGTASILNRFAASIRYLMDNGLIAGEDWKGLTPINTTKAALAYETSSIYLNYQALKKAFAKSGLAFPDPAILTDAFKATDILLQSLYDLRDFSGWLVTRAGWSALG